jgi:hypothetical protein
MKKLRDASQPRQFASEAKFANGGEAYSCDSRDSKQMKGESHKRKPKDMCVEEMMERRPELKAAALFVANHLVQNPSATINDVHAAWDIQHDDSFTGEGNLDGNQGVSRYLFRQV